MKPAKDLHLIHGYLSQPECERMLDSIREFQKSHKLPLIHRKAAGRSLHYFVMDGEIVHEALPELVNIYGEVERVVKLHFGSATDAAAQSHRECECEHYAAGWRIPLALRPECGDSDSLPEHRCRRRD